jgi:chloramphenicol-sensitive protein RarD
VGLLQYITPTIQFLLGVLVYGEAFSSAQFVGFGLVWLALIIFTAENLWQRRRVQAQLPAIQVRAAQGEQ